MSYFTSPCITATITDSSGNVLCKCTIDYGEVDSSNLLTFGAIDETYVRKTELESLQSTIEELTPRIAALEANDYKFLNYHDSLFLSPDLTYHHSV